MVELMKVTGENLDNVIELQVDPSQEVYIETTNLKSMAEAYTMVMEDIPVFPFAIMVEGNTVGFFMYIYDVLDHESFKNESFYNSNTCFIWHNMIDQQYQGQGYGKSAFEQMLKVMEDDDQHPTDNVSLFYHKDNSVAKKLYHSFGFVDSGIIQGNSILAIKKIK